MDLLEDLPVKIKEEEQIDYFLISTSDNEIATETASDPFSNGIKSPVK